MKIKILSLGEKPPKWVGDGFEEYRKRLSKAILLELIELPIAKRTKTGNPTLWLEQEAKTILNRLNDNDYLVILDVQSKIISTEELANKIHDWKLHTPNVVILIGGPDGIDQSIKNLARDKISISKMTFPHPIVRIIIAEQIYRAHTILVGHPYHK
ncbi:23S rRNA (pseudouridine(1915)-N(3))-methyltransferase RlmH [Allofrancisella guangzhouensis]|uniref:Ribosomal RNA large subunit methyltransferase H n=1 Tax=Allofrancisella guangzhouensis TaxID=594679 RepID=A0A0A8E369_9GAMM|nr:23S rRNA (pseudouridine(1915)-N(3))-methyltransferase RlmH [Allofrancisella guangzhouensis]AJC48655.1 50S rRNA methyltransferase [Allofrancisella guangzhouensis]MBK2027860.1 23S rRNA (pseudouridine(1915)-N(3))-methyltransferase RlmH [Allofrancisella guangzhouensis]MBK2044933.1 23S rRNA (pseudouridine(1915)-N(3))-methyltransferase RlmH [Allofrancisella guangzhouensis]MBK2046455.1 23S rRNA (pseudouridine(1915)-N(3))-methyltransferase RlmH [Allofrancisella guangzhouensis]